MRNYSEKIKAVMMGHVVADALGVPVEFQERYELDRNPVRGMRGYGTYNVPEGSWSDDSSMAIATLDSLSGGEVDFDDIMEKFCAWYFDNEYTPTGRMFDVGYTCASAINTYKGGKRPATRCGEDGDHSNGNGSLMRIHPLVLYAYTKGLPQDEWIDLIAQGSCLTHAHERSEIGCGIFSFILMRLLECPEISIVYLALKEAGKYYADFAEVKHYSRLFDGTIYNLERPAIKSTGYVVDSLEAAVWCLLNSNSYSECVLSAVNLGGDTDTIAAIAGSLAGALYGYDDIPDEWLSVIKRREYIEGMCDRAAEAWI